MTRRIAFAAAITMLLIYTVFPFYWALNGSFQPEEKIFASPASYFPFPPTLIHYERAFANDAFVRSLRNSAIVAGGTTVLSLLLGSLAACALGRFRMRGRSLVLMLILGMTMFPQISVLGAVYRIISALRLYNHYGGLILSYLLFTLPFTVWVMTSFFRALPQELEESAYVDGATPLQTFWQILLPLSLPGLATTGLLSFIAAWNEYLFALSFTVTKDVQTVPVVIANFAGQGHHETPWGAIMAASVIVTVPLVVLVLIFQRQIIAGLTAGAVKG
ncbi:carbohydrate ABC transporter permease [Candidatus Poribacteria bacterium]|nr:carbohydrate ABC transporter permease [Candidatus Poribacteria bacterium]